MELIEKIKKLKGERNAVILAHNYQLPEVQDIADYVGDSLGLSIQASKTQRRRDSLLRRVFHGGNGKDHIAGKDSADPGSEGRLSHGGHDHGRPAPGAQGPAPRRKVVCYVNTTAEVKAECDLCCTSANAERIVRKHSETTKRSSLCPTSTWPLTLHRGRGASS